MSHKDNVSVEVTPAKPAVPAQDGVEAQDAVPAQAVIKDEVAKRAWSGEGKNESEAATEATRKFLGDRRTNEYLEK